MPTVLTHLALGAAAYRVVDRRESGWRTGATVAAVISALPDADVFYMRWVPYAAPWGHRGMTHSIAFAALLGVAAALVFRKRIDFPAGTAALALSLAVITASHGLLDALTNGGHGIALLAPFNHTRHFFAWIIPVSPLGPHPRLFYVLAWEFALFGPATYVMWTARSPWTPLRVASLAAAVLLGAAAWLIRIL